MKKLALATAIAAVATSAQAAVQTTTFTGTLTSRLDASAYVPPGTYAASTGTAAVSFSIEVDADNGVYTGARLTLNGTTSTFGASGIPKFAQQEVVFSNAVYTFDTSSSAGTSTVIPYFSTNANPAFSYNTVEGTVVAGAGAATAGDAIGDAFTNISLTSGGATCTAKNGDDCTGDWSLGNIDGLGMWYQIEFGQFVDVGFNELSIQFNTLSGGTGLALTTAGTSNLPSGTGPIVTPPNPIPVPAAAWLFGSALVGMAGIGRKRKAA